MKKFKATTKVELKGVREGEDKVVIEEGTYFDYNHETNEIHIDGETYVNSKLIVAASRGWLKECTVHDCESTMNGSVDFMKK